jgi:hypothetical protein
MAAMLDFESLELVRVDDEVMVFTFHLQPPNGKREEAWENLRAEMTITGHPEDPWIKNVRVWNVDAFKPAFGVRFESVEVQLSFDALGEFVLPSSADLKFAGRAFLVVSLDEQARMQFGEYSRDSD